MGKKVSFNDVLKAFQTKGYILLEKEYQNNRASMRYICFKHPQKVRTIRFGNLRRGDECRSCTTERNASKKRHSFEFIKNEFEARGYVLKATEYINNKTKMPYTCPEHPETELEICYDKLKQGKGCKLCGIIHSANAKRYTFDEVKAAFEERGYELLETVYKDSLTPMRYRCPFHPDIEMSIIFNAFKQNIGCMFCGGRAKLTIKEVSEKFTDRGYELREKEYINAQTLMVYTCPKHPDKDLQIKYGNLYAGKGCPYCANELIAKMFRGKNSPLWKGTSSLNQFLRRGLKEWRRNILKNYDYKCDITGVNHSDIQIHHFTPFYIIRDQVLNELNLPVHEDLNHYKQEELEQMILLLQQKHNALIGIPIRFGLHMLFHSQYRLASYADYLEFKERYLNGELGEIDLDSYKPNKY